MNDVPLAAPPRTNLPEYSVSELSAALKRSIEQNFAFVRVRGEVSGFKRHGSGHLYLCLKDAEAVLDAVCWRTTAMRLRVRPEDGMEVVCTGRLTTFPGRSKYQLIVDTMELAAPWDRILDLYHRVRAAIQPHAVTLAHFSHAYPEGCSVYFTFAAHVASEDETETRYRAIWKAGIDAALAADGTVSHHHGVGLLKAEFMRTELGGFLEAYTGLKRALDPENVLNPGKMGLP